MKIPNSFVGKSTSYFNDDWNKRLARGYVRAMGVLLPPHFDDLPDLYNILGQEVLSSLSIYI